MLSRYRDIADAKRALADVWLDPLEAHVLYRHVWQRLPLHRLADFLDVTEADLARARDSLVRKANCAQWRPTVTVANN